MIKMNVISCLVSLTLSISGASLAQNADCQANIDNPERVVYGLNGNLFIPSQDFNSEIPYKKYISYFSETAKLLKSRGIELIFVPISHKGLTEIDQLNLNDPLQKSYNWKKARSDYEIFIRDMALKKLNIVNVLKIAEQKKSQFINKTDWHWNPQSAKLVADATASLIKKLPAYSQTPARDFSTITYPLSLTGGSAYYSDQLEKRCGIENKTIESFDAYKTQMTSKVDLLSDDTPQIILAGTSFSASPWNFDGLLEQALQREVTNYAVIGGGVHSGIQSYLLGNDFKQNKPKIIVWEFDVDRIYDSILEQHHWQQLLDFLKADCNNVRPIFTGKLSMRATDFKLNSPPSNTIVKLSLSDLGVRFFDLVSYKASKPLMTISVGRWDFIKNSGDFYIKIPQSDRITLKIPDFIKDFKGDYSVTLCKSIN